MRIPSLKLNTGVELPVIGFGTWKLPDGNLTRNAVLTAIAAGYRIIDTARIYGNERSVGEAISESHVPRNEVFVTTKLWPNDFGYESAFEAFEASLERLGLDYLDLYLIHWPNGSSRKDAWRALTEIHKHGKTKAVGVSNYTVEHLKELLEESELVPAVNQIEFHPFNYRQQAPILDFCKAHNIVVEAYSPLARGYHMDEPLIIEVAEKYSKSTAQIMLRWAIQHVTIPIPKSATPERINENLKVFDFVLTDEDMAALNDLS